MSISKEKRTKEQMMALLDRAIEQEEILLGKVSGLEAELANCRKKAENPRHELDEHALPGSKVSFRLDYYRTEKKGPFKGIIEHLPTRESRSFEENGINEIGDFVAQFVGMNTSLRQRSNTSSKPKTPLTFPPEIIEDTIEAEKKERSPLLKKLFPELFGNPTPILPIPETAEPVPTPEQLESEPFLVLTEGNEEHQRTLRRGQSFQIQIPMQALSTFHGKACSVSLFAKSLERNPAKTLEALEYCFPDQDFLRVPVRAFPLEQGVYRLVVSMTFRDEPQTAFYRDDRLLIVQ
ncbi:MAG: hypothetical protein ACKVU0_14035 [Saprospiraceae bacterium]